MNFLSDHNIYHIVEAAGLACDTVALYVQRTEAVSPLSISFEEVMRHPLMQRALLRQEEDLSFVSSLSSCMDREEVQQIKERSEQMPVLIPFES